MELTVREAALRVGVHKTSLGRAIRSGRLSARRLDTGGYMIDTSELFRVYPPAPDASEQDSSTPRSVLHDAPPEDVIALHVRCATAEAQLQALQQVLAAAERREADLRQERDDWKAQAQRLALPAPAPNGDEELRQERDYWREEAERLAQPVAMPDTPRRRWWWRRAG